MDHPINQVEFDILSNVDFVVPLKRAGLITRSVLEGVHKFYKPRRIIVVTAKEEAQLLQMLTPLWDVGVVECVFEEDFFLPNYNLSIQDIYAEYDYTRKGDQREPGWWFQQLIKIGAATQIRNISDTYVVWDGDLVPTRRWKLCDVDPATGEVRFFIAILQGESRSEFNTTQYAHCMKALTGMSPIEPPAGGTFVAHHMVFQKEYVHEMLNLMEEKTASLEPWPLLIMSHSRKYFRFSEYKTYATFMVNYHPDRFFHHELPLFGDGGLRFREANAIMDDILKASSFTNGGLSYGQLIDYVNANWKSLSSSHQSFMPGYIQLDHVYGLNLNDLRITGGPIPEGTEPGSPDSVEEERGRLSRESEKSSISVFPMIVA